MADERIVTTQALLGEMADAWSALDAALERLSPAQLTGTTDAAGWTVKDHVIHMAAWGQSAISFLRHEPRHVGLGIDEALYLTEDFDVMNAEIQRRNQGLPVAEALAWLRATHEQLAALVAQMSDAELARPYRYFLPDEPGAGEGRPGYDVVYANSAGHYREHLEWITSLVGKR